jgi:hypothetical protein
MALGLWRYLDYNANAAHNLYIIVMARRGDVEIGYRVTFLQQGNRTGRPCSYATRYTTLLIIQDYNIVLGAFLTIIQGLEKRTHGFTFKSGCLTYCLAREINARPYAAHLRQQLRSYVPGNCPTPTPT